MYEEVPVDFSSLLKKAQVDLKQHADETNILNMVIFYFQSFDVYHHNKHASRLRLK